MFIVHSIHSCHIAEATEQQTVKTSDRLRAFRSHLVRKSSSQDRGKTILAVAKILRCCAPRPGHYELGQVHTYIIIHIYIYIYIYMYTHTTWLRNSASELFDGV